MKVKVKEVKANPYRNIKHYPLSEEKLDALRTSIKHTGFWDNIVGREINGEIQIAYGHHRLEAVRQEKGEDFEFNLIIKDLQDADMIKVMANENMSEWSHSLEVIDETVKVAKDFIAENMTDAGVGHKATTKLEYQNQVNAPEIAEFLKWNETKVKISLKRINLIKAGTLDEKAVLSMPSATHAEVFATAINLASDKSGVDFTPFEQNKIAKRINDEGLGKAVIKDLIKKEVFDKKYPSKETKKIVKRDERIISFEQNLFRVAEEINSVSNDIKKLSKIYEGLKNIETSKGVYGVRSVIKSSEFAIKNLQDFVDKMNSEKLEMEEKQEDTQREKYLLIN